ncbi:PAS domain S-box-containing protein [Algoriphagus sp. 4150]|uniref:sensor histidine kinase n=1 Tax=Algoriphagus sp. 4150 TaxID=2817756 RepID=UPI00286221FB|nr:ATP-binding protein [Algoriphagus sp. 4150]MDR7127877.1 PAS domain S-box-containing protein [Algoriphagus sp. 4150]
MKDNPVAHTFPIEYRFQRMIEEVQDYAIILLDADGNVQNWNKGAEKIKGYSEREILGKNFSVFYLMQDREEGLPLRLIEEAKVNGRATHEGWRVRKDGSAFWGNIVITALHDEADQVIGFTKVTRDLTERKLAEEQKERDAISIEMQNKQLKEFAYVASHDLQEPIRKIRAFVDLARLEIDNRENLEWYLEKIDTSAEKMIQLIKDVLDFSRISHDSLVFTDVDLNFTVKNVLLEYEMLIAEKQVKIELSDLPVIKGIPIQLYQLFSNLISNAIKFNYGEPQITLESSYFDGDGSSSRQVGYLISITDNGIGFEQEYAEQAFQPFKRLSKEFEGTGIGLALCKKIVENHKGSISVKSKSGKGTTFTIFFPMTLS